MIETETQSGGCLCSAVRFSIPVPQASYAVCHCSMCRKWSGGPFMSVHCPGDVTYTEDTGLAWYRGSEWAERGFCSKCGTSLFWRLADTPEDMLIVSVEAFDEADSFTLGRHIYVDAQPDHYAFSDDTPRLTEAELMAEMGLSEAE